MTDSSSPGDYPKVSIIVPMRNEEKFIGRLLDSILQNNYPQDKLEIVTVDGISEDNTREVVKQYAQKYSFIKLLSNPKRTTPFAMNIGIQNATGDVSMIINAHSVIDKDFIINNILCLQETGADAVGGALNTVNVETTLIARAIPLAADSVFGSGGRRYRSGATEGWVKDTLPYCAYPKRTFEKFGHIDEELIRDQDEEFNYRILKGGGRIYFSPKVRSHLHLRPSLRKLWRQHFQYGYFKVRVAQKVGAALTWRQLIPSLFVSSLFVTGVLSFFSIYAVLLLCTIAGLYLIGNLGSSFIIAVRNGILLLLVLPVCFLVLHFSYGLGFLMGIWAFAIRRKHLRQKPVDVPLTR